MRRGVKCTWQGALPLGVGVNPSAHLALLPSAASTSPAPEEGAEAAAEAAEEDEAAAPPSAVPPPPRGSSSQILGGMAMVRRPYMRPRTVHSSPPTVSSSGPRSAHRAEAGASSSGPSAVGGIRSSRTESMYELRQSAHASVSVSGRGRLHPSPNVASHRRRASLARLLGPKRARGRTP